jgi:sugar diacid utilization regulator
LENRITINDRFVGIAGMLEYDRSIEEKDYEILQLISRVVSCEMQKESFFSHTKGITYEFLIADLLDGRISNPAIIHERISSLALDFKEDLYLLTVRDLKETPENPALLYLRNLLENTISGSKSVLYKDSIVLLVGCKKNKPLTEADLESVKDVLKENRLVGGISLCFHDVAGIQEYYRQASKSIELGMRLKKEEENVLFSYEEFAFYDLVDIAGSQQDLRSFCDPLVFDLIDYDRTNNTDFTRSLYEYLSSGNNPKESASVLGIHRNTLDYRIKRIEEILNININDPKVTWSLHFSFKIFDLMGGMNFLAERQLASP